MMNIFDRELRKKIEVLEHRNTILETKNALLFAENEALKEILELLKQRKTNNDTD